MMLDSTLNKILSTKPSELPVVEHEATQRPDSPISPTEAEVRLVVKFTVEEHIVYKGKIERIHQLDSEELSRTVSRVIWTPREHLEEPSSKTTDKVINESLKSTMIHEPMICMADDYVKKLTNESQQNQCQNFTTSKNLGESGNPTDELPVPLSSESLDLQKHTTDDLEETLISPVLEKPKTSPSSSLARSEESSPTFHPENQLSKSVDSLSSKDTLCPSTANINETESNDVDLKTISNNNIEPPSPDMDISSNAESPSVIDTLNECLESVDKESRSEVVAENPKTIVISSNLKTNQIVDDQEIHKKCVEDTDVHLICDSDMTFLNSDTRTHTVPEHSHEVVVEASHAKESVEHFSEAEEVSVAEMQLPHANVDLQTSKKKTSDNPVTSKRVRRTNSRDSRSSKKRPRISESTENHTPIKQEVIVRAANHSNGLVRHSKIFAKWSDNHFYPGTILKPSKDRKIVVGFFDGAQRNVSEMDLIPLNNITGKQVRVTIGNHYCVNAIVHNERSPVNDQPMFDVEYRSGQENIRKCVPLKDIFLTGEQGTPLINQTDRNSGASNFADVDLDNIIYEKRSRRLQELDEFEVSENSTILAGKRRRTQHQGRNSSPKLRVDDSVADCSSDTVQNQARQTQDLTRDLTSSEGTEHLKSNLLGSNFNPSSDNSNSTGSSNIPTPVELGQEFYFSSSSPHRTNTSLLL